MPSISAINYPSYDDLGRSAEQKLSRSINCERAQTQCSRTVHFLKFISRYDLGNRYLTDDVIVTDEILLRYVNYLLEGFTLQKIKIEVGTIKGYMRAVNEHYKKHRLPLPWDLKSDSKGVELLNQQESYEKKPDRREPLHDKVLVKMMQLSEDSHALSFRRAIWLWSKLGRYTGFRRQEFAMEKQLVIQYHIKPDGTRVVRSFCLKDFIWYDEDGMIISLAEVLADRELAVQVGHHYEIQKNRQNNQIVTQNRDTAYPSLCTVEASIDIVELAMQCGSNGPSDPLCVFQSEDGSNVYLTGDMITKYYRHVTQMVFPTISVEELRLFSCHSIRVKAAVLLHEAGKYASYIKLRLRWLSDCFQVYLRNTRRICAQHNASLKNVNDIILKALELSRETIPDDAVHSEGVTDTELELEDED